MKTNSVFVYQICPLNFWNGCLKKFFSVCAFGVKSVTRSGPGSSGTSGSLVCVGLRNRENLESVHAYPGIKDLKKKLKHN